jgi:hypothetical protein
MKCGKPAGHNACRLYLFSLALKQQVGMKVSEVFQIPLEAFGKFV